jgi:outer membrane murein-binding lipoprotein Lpp
MSTNEIVGWAVVVGIPLIGSVIALVKPIINLNTNITKLALSIEQLSRDSIDVKKDVRAHTEKLEDHETRLQLIEHSDLHTHNE